jgi:hypothetical protein
LSDVLAEIEKSSEIAERIYWLGSSRQINNLNTNVYLLLDGDEAVLFGAGPVVDFEIIYSNLTEIIKIEQLGYIIIQDEDPSACAAISLFEKNGFSGTVITHYNISSYIRYYGIRSEIVYGNLSANRLFLRSGRIIRFYNTPYLKSAALLQPMIPLQAYSFPGTSSALQAVIGSSMPMMVISLKWRNTTLIICPTASSCITVCISLIKKEISGIAPGTGQ